MGMQSAQVQSGTQPQGKGFAQPVNPPAQAMGNSNKMGRLPAMISDELSAPAVMPEQQRFTNQVMGGSPYRTKDMLVPQGEQVYGLTGGPSFQNQGQPTYQPQMQNRGKGGSTTNAATSGQPNFGQPNRYPNTVGQWDNASIQRTNQQPMGGGKGKG